MPANIGSVITRTLRAPMSARSIPTSRVTPGPKRMLEAAISKAISFFIPRRDITAKDRMLQRPIAWRELGGGHTFTVTPDGTCHLQQIISRLTAIAPIDIQNERSERRAQFQ